MKITPGQLQTARCKLHYTRVRFLTSGVPVSNEIKTRRLDDDGGSVFLFLPTPHASPRSPIHFRQVIRLLLAMDRKCVELSSAVCLGVRHFHSHETFTTKPGAKARTVTATPQTSLVACV